jgi:hypothetical protein
LAASVKRAQAWSSKPLPSVEMQLKRRSSWSPALAWNAGETNFEPLFSWPSPRPLGSSASGDRFSACEPPVVT